MSSLEYLNAFGPGSHCNYFVSYDTSKHIMWYDFNILQILRGQWTSVNMCLQCWISEQGEFLVFAARHFQGSCVGRTAIPMASQLPYDTQPDCDDPFWELVDLSPDKSQAQPDMIWYDTGWSWVWEGQCDSSCSVYRFVYRLPLQFFAFARVCSQDNPST